jgi:hypothetical protein
MGSKRTYPASGWVAKISSSVWPMLAPISTNAGWLPRTSLSNTFAFHEPSHLKWLRVSFKLTPEHSRGIFMLTPRRFTPRREEDPGVGGLVPVKQPAQCKNVRVTRGKVVCPRVAVRVAVKLNCLSRRAKTLFLERLSDRIADLLIANRWSQAELGLH